MNWQLYLNWSKFKPTKWSDLVHSGTVSYEPGQFFVSFNQASTGRRPPRHPGVPNSLIPSWESCFVSQKIFHQERRPFYGWKLGRLRPLKGWELGLQRSRTAGTSTSWGALVSTVTLAWYLLYNRVNRTYYLRYLIVRFLNRFKVVYLQSVTLFTVRYLQQYCMFEKYRFIRRFILATIFRNKTDFIHFHYFLFQSGIILFDGF